jgi:hypothetical protein
MLLAACAVQFGAKTAEAHVLDLAVATPNCGTNTIGLHLTGTLMEDGPFSVPYTITFTCSDGGPAIAPISNIAPGHRKLNVQPLDVLVVRLPKLRCRARWELPRLIWSATQNGMCSPA